MLKLLAGHINYKRENCFIKGAGKNMYGDKVVTKKQEKKIKAKKRKKLKVALVILIVLAAVAAVTVAYYFIAKPFKISALRFSSEDPDFETDARPILEEYLGQNALELIFREEGIKGVKSLFEGKITSIENELSFMLPQYKDITVRFDKNRFLIAGGEPRGAYVLLSENGEIIVTDRTGAVVLVCGKDELKREAASFAGLEPDGPVVSGLGISGYALGAPVEYGSDVSWNDVMGIYFAVISDDALAENVLFIYYPSVSAPYFYCKNNIVVKIGDASSSQNLYSKLERLSSIFRAEDGRFVNGTITLSDSGKDVFRPDAGLPEEENNGSPE